MVRPSELRGDDPFLPPQRLEVECPDVSERLPVCRGLVSRVGVARVSKLGGRALLLPEAHTTMDDELVVDDCTCVGGSGYGIVSVALVSLPFRGGIGTQQRQCLGLVVERKNVAEDVRRLRSLGGEVSRVVVRRVVVVHSAVESEVSPSPAVYEVAALSLASGQRERRLRLDRGGIRVFGYVASRRRDIIGCADSPAMWQITAQVRFLATAVVRLAFDGL